MTPKQWQRAKDVLAEAIGKTEREQERLINQAFPGDSVLHAELRQLLRSATDATLRFPRTAALDGGVLDTGARSRPRQPLAASALLSQESAAQGAQSALFEPGQTLEHYRILRQLGAGGMGQVFLAENTHVGTPVALKVVTNELLDSESARIRLRHEAGRAAQLHGHDNIATVHEFLEITLHGRLIAVLVMAFVAGVPASTRIAEGQVPTALALEWAIQVADAMQAAHEIGILHCDLKPSNVMIVGDHKAKVLDFGIARTLYDTSADDAISGTLPYMAPEVLNGRHSGQGVDIYSLGVMLFELLTGRRPFTAPTFDQYVLEALGAPRPRASDFVPTIPRHLDDVVVRALATLPEDRYQSAQEFRLALLAVKTRLEARRHSQLTPMMVRMLLAAVALGVLSGLGFWTSWVLDQALGRSGRFSPDSPLSWPFWGARALLPPVTFALFYLAALSFVRAAWSVVARARRSHESSGQDRAPDARHARSPRFLRWYFDEPDAANVGQIVFSLHCACLAGLVAGYWPLLDAIVDFALHRPDAPLRLLARDDWWTSTYQDLYGIALSIQLFIFSLAWAQLIPRLREHRDGRFWLTGAALAFTFMLVLIATPYRVIHHADGERAAYRSQSCYLVGQADRQSLVFCPISQPQRQVVAEEDQQQLERTGIVESIYSVLRTPAP